MPRVGSVPKLLVIAEESEVPVKQKAVAVTQDAFTALAVCGFRNPSCPSRM
jgi:hypothetical protein